MMETTTEIEEKKKKMMKIGGEEHEEKKTEQIVAKLLAQASIEDGGGGEQCCAAGSSGTSTAGIEEGEEELATNSSKGELDADKQKSQFQMWLNENDNCLYPTREQKQRLADKMGIDFVKVNKLFANHRRRQQKQQKIVQLQKMEQQFVGENNKENRRHHLQLEDEESIDKIDQTIEEIRSKVTGRKQPRLSLMAGGSGEHHGGGNNGEIAVPIASSQLSPPPSVHPSPPHHGQSVVPPPNLLPQGLDLLQLLAASTRHPPPPLPPTFQPHQQQLFGQQSAAIFGGKSRQSMAMVDPNRPNPQQQAAPQLAANSHANLMLAALAHVHQQQQLAAQQQQQQQQFAMVKAAIEKEIFELLNAAQNHQNMTMLAQRHQLLDQIQRGEQQPNQQQQAGQMHAPMATNNIMMMPQNVQQPIGLNVALPPPHLPISHAFLSPANSAINGSCGSPSSSACSTDSILAQEEEANSFNLDLVEKQIAAQNNRLSAAEAEAAAVLLGLSTAGGVGR